MDFILQGGEGVNAGLGEVEWVVEKDRMKYDEAFDKLSPMDGKISGAGWSWIDTKKHFCHTYVGN